MQEQLTVDVHFPRIATVQTIIPFSPPVTIGTQQVQGVGVKDSVGWPVVLFGVGGELALHNLVLSFKVMPVELP